MNKQSRESSQVVEKLRNDLAKVDTEIGNIMTAIKAGIITESTKAGLESAEAAKKGLQRMIDSQASANKRARVDPRAIEQRFREMLKDLTDSFAANPEKARQYIASLVGREILLYPTEDGVLEAVISGSLEAPMGTNDSQVFDSHQYDICGCGGRT